METAVVAHRSHSSSWQRLPPEILATIFVLTLDDGNDDDDNDNDAQHHLLKFPPQLSKPPWILRRICSTWRHIALNEPLLWNSIDITWLPNNYCQWAPLVNHVIHPTALLSVSIQCHSAPSSWKAVTGFVAPQIRRIRSLNLLIEVNAFTKLLDTATSTRQSSSTSSSSSLLSFSSLESLRLDLWSGKSHPLEQLSIIKRFRRTLVFRDSTHLKRVDLSCRGEVLFSHALLALPIPWDRLTSLRFTKLQPLRVPDVVSVLRRCFLLGELRVAFYYRGVVGVSGAMSGDDGFEAYSSAPEDDDESAFLDLPHLTSVMIQEYIPAPHSMFNLKLPWGNLAQLHLHQLYTLSLADAYQVLTLCANSVEDLSLNITSASASVTEDEWERERERHVLFVPTAKKPVRMRKLRALDIHALRGIIFTYLDAPVLETLIISGRPGFFGDITGMIERSQCRILKFTYTASQTFGLGDRDDGNADDGVYDDDDDGYDGDDGDVEGMRRFLMCLPYVVKFQVPNMVLDVRTVEAIRRREVLPQMTSLACELRWRTLVPFVELIEARSGGEEEAEEEAPAMKYALGTYLMDSRSDSWDVARDAACRVQKLNEELGTEFKILTRI